MLERRKLGRQGLEVSAIGLGCMGMSQSYEPGEDWGWCYVESRELGPFPPARRA
jgi:aryl-alcohol dehydrogenase-like predicted oxidoreductase